MDSAGLKHWHGATATNGMTHIAIQEEVNGKNVDWMEKVSEEEYRMMATTNRMLSRQCRSMMMFGWSHRPSSGTRKASFLAISGNALIYRHAIAASLPWRS